MSSAVSGASLFATSRDRGTTCFYYALSELPDLDRQLLRYYAALAEDPRQSAFFVPPIQAVATSPTSALVGLAISANETVPTRSC